MRAVITGGHGFVGRHLERHLRASGDEVLIIDRHGDHAVDITDGPAIAAKLADVAPDAVYHLAGWADVGASWRDPVGARSEEHTSALQSPTRISIADLCLQQKIHKRYTITTAIQ